MVKITIRLVGDENDKLFKRIELDPQIHVDDLVKEITTVTNIPSKFQQVQFRGEKLPVVERPLQDIKFGEEIIVKHSMANNWTAFFTLFEAARQALATKQIKDVERNGGLICNVLRNGSLLGKYYVKEHIGLSNWQHADLREIFIYKLFELIQVGPEVHFIPNTHYSGLGLYIGTKEVVGFRRADTEGLEISNELYAQRDLLRRVLCVKDLHSKNYGVDDKGKLSIVDFQINGSVDSAAVLKATPELHQKKFMLSVFWDMEELIWSFWIVRQHLTLLNTFNSSMNISTALATDRPHKSKIILLYDNARSHVSSMTREKLKILGWEVLIHSPYNPNLVPSDYYLFRSMSNALVGQDFDPEDWVKKLLMDFYAPKSKTFYEKRIRELPEKWEKIIKNNGQYLD
ncbi:unnamed protein product, partial [Mesorhabditis belari]|uniref:Ubiquitin-like domain-containing protein n=1 Tax=Mesorhabditis belari TaxID=2138241 RepID=A0AAF3J632_9BILA